MLLHHNFIESAKRNPNQVCVYDQATGRDLTYKQILLASLLIKDKISKGDKYYTGVMLPTSAGCMISILSVLMSGKVPVMINYSTGADKNCEFARDRCGFKTIITTKKLLDKLEIKQDENMVLIEDLIQNAGGFSKLKAGVSSLTPKLFVSNGNESDTSIILFTSGSEKEPKIVPLSHKNILSNIEGLRERVDFNADDTFIAVLPNFHIYGLTTSFWLPLVCGSSIVAHTNPLEYEIIAKSIKKYQGTVLTATPTFFHGYNKKSVKGDFDSLRVTIAGGDKLSNHIREAFLEKHDKEIYEGYGTTETSPVISFNAEGVHKVGSIGKPLSNVEVKIIDIDTDDKVEAGKIGKIYVKGDLVMNGYLGNIEETSLRMHGGWYDTGDMGVLDEDGYLWHKGRLRRFVKVGGEMVSLVAVEDALESILPKDCCCCVVDTPHPIRGTEIVAAISGDYAEKELRSGLKKILPAISLPKKYIEFESLPMMGNGKVNFREVTKICHDRLK